MAGNLQPFSALLSNASQITGLSGCTVAFWSGTTGAQWVPANARAIQINPTGSWSMNFDTVSSMQSTIVAGQVYSSEVWVYCTAASRSMTIDGGFFVTSGGTFVNSFTTPPTVALSQFGWTKVASLNQTAGASTTKLSTKLYSQGTWASGDTTYLMAFRVLQSATLPGFWTPGPGDPPEPQPAGVVRASLVRASSF